MNNMTSNEDFDAFDYTRKKINESLESYRNSLREITDSIVLPNLNMIKIETLKISVSLKSLTDGIIESLKPFQDISRELTKEFSEEAVKEKVNNIICWAKYGWVITDIGVLSFTIFFDVIESQQEADQTIGEYINKEDVNGLFNDLRKLSKGKNEYQEYESLNEAIFCYRHKKYISCINTLLPLFDNELIKLQMYKAANQRKKVGKGATEKLQSYFKCIEHDSGLMSHFLYAGVISYLEMLYENTNDFTIQQTNVNRNYPLHGINTKVYTEIDCLKMFIAYKALLILIEMFY